MKRNIIFILPVIGVLVATIVGTGILFYQWQQGQKSLEAYQQMQVDFDRDFENKLASYETLQEERLENFIDFADTEYHTEIIPPYEVFLEKNKKYDDFLERIQREIIEDQKPSVESLERWKVEQNQIKEALANYQKDKDKDRWKKLHTYSEQQIQKLEDNIQTIQQLVSVDDFWLWKNTFNELRLQNRILALDLLSVTVIHLSSVGLFYDWLDIAVLPSALTVAKGETFEAEIFVTGENFCQQQYIKVNDSEYRLNENQRAKYVIQNSSLGKKTLNIQAIYKDGFGKERTMKKNFEYEVVPQCR